MFFICLGNTIMVAGIIALCGGAWMAIVQTISERIVRGLALVADVFAYLAAKALGISIPAVLIRSVDDSHWFSLLTLGAVLPSFAGFFLIRYVLRCMRRHDSIAIRVMLMVSSLVLVMFSDVYVAAVNQVKLNTLTPLLPNVTFVLTMICYVVFEYQPLDKEAAM